MIGIAISAAFLYFTFRGQDLGAIFAEIRRANPLPLLIGTAFTTFIFWIRAWRWRSILEPVRKNTSFTSRFAGVTIGAMGNNLLPARVGEFARAYAFSRMEPVSVVAAFSSLVIERLFDGLFLVAFLFLAMVMPGFPDMSLAGDVAYVTVARTLVFILAIAFGTLFLLVLWPTRIVDLLEQLLAKVLPLKIRRPLIDALEAFLAGASSLRNPGLVLRCAGWTAALWLVNAVSFWFAFRAFGMPLPASAALFFQSCLALAVSVPSGPAFIGPYQAGSTFVLVRLFGQEAAKAGAFAVGFHIAGFLPVTLMGLYYANKIGLSLSGVAHTEEQVEAAVEKETGVDPEHPRHPHTPH
ncbi:MAG: lysylphosphatidylglycerol synthase transmembrane domain-containing protein [Longimicrobiales bacterium]